jgi:hypothetical protein
MSVTLEGDVDEVEDATHGRALPWAEGLAERRIEGGNQRGLILCRGVKKDEELKMDSGLWCYCRKHRGRERFSGYDVGTRRIRSVSLTGSVARP